MHPAARRLLGVAVLTTTFLLGSATADSRAARKADDSRMSSALKSLKTAKTQLKSATPDKGGHCANAIEDIDNAIEEVERGIEFVRNE